jgi:hypothetical protein
MFHTTQWGFARTALPLGIAETLALDFSEAETLTQGLSKAETLTPSVSKAVMRVRN